MSNPLISVVMPVWNGERYVAEALDGILGQTFRDWELLVIDDGSTDRTPQIVRARTDPRIRLVPLDHGGIVHALNAGINLAGGAWIARQDADDISLPDRLQRQWDALQQNPSAVLSYTNVELVGERIPIFNPPRLPRTRAFLALRLCYQSPLVHSTVVFRRDVAIRAGGYVPEERHAEDFSLWGRLLEHGEFIGLPEKLLKYRIHPESVSRQNADLQREVARKIAIGHCHRFLGLNPHDAERAHRILSTPPHQRRLSEWWWFARRAATGLRWKSAEAYSWLLWQSLKQLLPARQAASASHPGLSSTADE